MAEILATVMAVFAVIGALDKIFGNRLKLGDEFEKGITTLGPLSLSMLGMMTIAPALADLLLPVITPVANLFGFDPSALAGILIANDMGGAALADSVAADTLLCNTSINITLVEVNVKIIFFAVIFFFKICSVIS